MMQVKTTHLPTNGCVRRYETHHCRAWRAWFVGTVRHVWWNTYACMHTCSHIWNSHPQACVNTNSDAWMHWHAQTHFWLNTVGANQSGVDGQAKFIPSFSVSVREVKDGCKLLLDSLFKARVLHPYPAAPFYIKCTNIEWRGNAFIPLSW